MSEAIRTDLCVIGAGSAGLSVAAGASRMGASVVLIEKGRMGGDCLNYGCVPSKALLAAAHAAQGVREAGRFGIAAAEPGVDLARVRDHVREVIAAIAPNDSVERFEGLGVRVIRAEARFSGPDEVRAGECVVRARRTVVATGSAPLVPPIPGIAEVAFFTNETIFDNAELPAHLLVIGGGPIGLELAQAYRRLGAPVTVVEMARLLARDDPEIAAVAVARLREDGVIVHETTRVAAVERTAGGLALVCERDGETVRIEGSHLLVAAGRRAVVDGLGLEEAGIAYTWQGITVDSGLRTSNRKVFAIGDVAGPYRFTHMAAYQAGIVLRRALFRVPARVDYRAVPWVTFTDPEVAQVGLTEAEALDRHRGDCRVVRWRFADNDRAQAERRTEGLVKVVATRRGRVLGAAIVGAHAGELILPWALMIDRRLGIAAMASLIAPYPTLGEAGKRAAGAWFAPSLFSERTRRLVRFLLKFG
jgi:pyruvate/2-oxoglutarate dehydrogenase complex dihydrolipoamide dehydrogenase (E3) component